jgi:fructoselysine 6-kinase
VNKPLRIAAVGDNCVDIYTNLGQTFPGGGPVNFAVQARRAGTTAAYIGVIGDDTHGDWIADALAAEDVDTRYLLRQPGPTARAWVTLKNNDRTFLRADRGVRERLTITPDIDAYLARFDLVHTTLDGCVDTDVPRWHAQGRTISYDFSHRATPEQLALLPFVDVAFFSGQDLTNEAAYDRIVALHRQGARVVVITLGAGGSLALDDTHIAYQPAISIDIVDTLGAGDAFQAAFMIAHLHGSDLSVALQAGAERAAQACTSLGGFGHGHESI